MICIATNAIDVKELVLIGGNHNKRDDYEE
ncbi:hypothetical protein IGK47_000329 [Enterococcus sp. AZ007]